VALAAELPAQLSAGANVAIHCRNGIGRASTLAAIILVLEGTQADQAWAHISAARGMTVPDTVAQRTSIASLWITVTPSQNQQKPPKMVQRLNRFQSGSTAPSETEMRNVPVIELRPVEDADLDALFDQMRDPESVRMAAFTAADPDDRSAFDAHMARVRTAPDITHRAITCDGHLVGSIAAFVVEGETDVTYWIDRAAWGRGIASRALELLLDIVPARPLHARAASDNTGSLRVLEKASFKIIGTENSFAPGRNGAIEETILRRD
jgi:RimJ/RimL family protein N-acetyltransferase